MSPSPAGLALTADLISLHFLSCFPSHLPPHPPFATYLQVVQSRPAGGDFTVKGLYAAGEAASASVHGANRLGANSLLDLVIFGRACAMDIVRNSRPGESQPELGEGMGEASVAGLERLLSSQGHTPTAALRLESQKVVYKPCRMC